MKKEKMKKSRAIEIFVIIWYDRKCLTKGGNKKMKKQANNSRFEIINVNIADRKGSCEYTYIRTSTGQIYIEVPNRTNSNGKTFIPLKRVPFGSFGIRKKIWRSRS